MDNGRKQREMAEFIKSEVKRQIRLRRDRNANLQVSISTPSNDSDEPRATHALTGKIDDALNVSEGSYQCAAETSTIRHDITLSRSEAFLVSFYVETLLPLQLPFYRPSHEQGGKSWILELMGRPVFRQVILSHSAYFLPLVNELCTRSNETTESMIAQSRDTFETLRKALQVMEGSSIDNHIHGAVRVLASIVHLLRFEVAISGQHSWQLHLGAATSLFLQLLGSSSSYRSSGSTFPNIMERLTLPTGVKETKALRHLPTAEQNAFQFSSSLLFFYDIIASTVLGTRPKLLECHDDLGHAMHDIEAVMGVRCTIIQEIGRIATLNVWKEQCLEADTFHAEEVLQRSAIIMSTLSGELAFRGRALACENNILLHSISFQAFNSQPINQFWAHAALVYLSIIVSGWQPANADIQANVTAAVALLDGQIPVWLLPSMAWPLCVIGCMAQGHERQNFRERLQSPRPAAFCASLHKALEIMEKAWQRKRGHRSFSSCFYIDEEAILLI